MCLELIAFDNDVRAWTLTEWRHPCQDPQPQGDAKDGRAHSKPHLPSERFEERQRPIASVHLILHLRATDEKLEVRHMQST